MELNEIAEELRRVNGHEWILDTAKRLGVSQPAISALRKLCGIMARSRDASYKNRLRTFGRGKGSRVGVGTTDFVAARGDFILVERGTDERGPFITLRPEKPVA